MLCDKTYEQHKYSNRNSCYLNGSNISSRRNISTASAQSVFPLPNIGAQNDGKGGNGGGVHPGGGGGVHPGGGGGGGVHPGRWRWWRQWRGGNGGGGDHGKGGGGGDHGKGRRRW